MDGGRVVGMISARDLLEVEAQLGSTDEPGSSADPADRG
jgi:hypothetical protein